MSNCRVALVALALACCSAGAASADTIVFQQDALLPGGATYTSTLDTEVAGAAPSTPAGSLTTLRADLLDPASGGAEVQALIQFGDLFGALPGQIPAGATITSAVLSLYTTNSSNGPIGNIAIYQMTTAWDESSTWNSLSGGVQIGSDTVAVADDDHTVESINVFATFDVLSSVLAWYGGATNDGWVITNDSTDGVQFRSSEWTTNAERPYLTIDFTPIPEPGSLLLAGLAGAGALCARRLRRGR